LHYLAAQAFIRALSGNTGIDFCTIWQHCNGFLHYLATLEFLSTIWQHWNCFWQNLATLELFFAPSGNTGINFCTIWQHLN